MVGSAQEEMWIKTLANEDPRFFYSGYGSDSSSFYRDHKPGFPEDDDGRLPVKTLARFASLLVPPSFYFPLTSILLFPYRKDITRVFSSVRSGDIRISKGSSLSPRGRIFEYFSFRFDATLAASYVLFFLV